MWKTSLIEFLTARLQRKLMLALMAIATAIIGVGGIYLLSSQQQSASSGLEARAVYMANMLSKTLAEPLWNIDLKSIKDQLDMVMSDPEIYSVALYEGEQKRLIASKKRDGQAVEGIEREAPVVHVSGQLQPPIELGRVHIVYTRSYLYQALRQMHLMILAGILFLLASLSAATYILLRRMVQKPVGELLAMVHRIAEGDLEVKIPVKSRDEIGLLSENFNHMAGKLKQTMDGLSRSEQNYRNINLQLTAEIAVRKQAEGDRIALLERLNRSEKMEALGTLAGGVAHDLNNVLGILSGYSELLVEGIPEGNRLREYAAHILKSTEKAAAIIDDLLTLARRGVVINEVVDLNRLVSNLLTAPEFYRLKDHHPHVTIKTELEKDLLNIKGSSVHLEKTVMNLVSNAAEAIVGSGEVNIRTENRYLDKAVRGYDHLEEGDYTVLTVSDTGTGISSEDMSKMFEPFYTKKKMGRSGTGLGLAIVWGTVQDHKGYIDVQSIEGKGTTFTLYFSVTRDKIREDPQKIPLAQYMGHGESVLVVDDVEGQRQVATALITQVGYQVNSVSSGEDAVEYLKSNKVDILLLDMIMEPGIDGLETYRRIIEINPQQKAILVSGFAETDRAKEAQMLGAGACIKKPYMKDKIGIAIRDELNRK